MTTKEMVEKALKGDKEAFNAIIKKYNNSVSLYVSSLCAGTLDKDDILQETYIKAFLKLDKYNSDYPIDIWLKTIARNTFIDLVRKKKSSETSEVSKTTDILEEGSSPEEIIISGERIRFVEQEISTLPTTYQKIIEMRYFQCMSYKEISDNLIVPIGTVKTQLFRARKMLVGIKQTLDTLE